MRSCYVFVVVAVVVESNNSSTCTAILYSQRSNTKETDLRNGSKGLQLPRALKVNDLALR